MEGPDTFAHVEEVASPNEMLNQRVEQDVLDERGDAEVFLASRSSRLLAQLLDGAAVGAAIGLGAIDGAAMAVGLVMVLIVLQTYLLSVEGQTIGKSLMKIKIVDKDDERNPGFGRAVMMRHVLPVFFSLIPFFSLADILFIFREDQRCIHDHLAGTKVIEDPDA